MCIIPVVIESVLRALLVPQPSMFFSRDALFSCFYTEPCYLSKCCFPRLVLKAPATSKSSLHNLPARRSEVSTTSTLDSILVPSHHNIVVAMDASCGHYIYLPAVCAKEGDCREILRTHQVQHTGQQCPSMHPKRDLYHLSTEDSAAVWVTVVI